MNPKELIIIYLQRNKPMFLQLGFVAAVLFVYGITHVKAQEIVYDTVKKEKIVVDIIDQYPEFKGGEEARQRFIQLKTNYPLEARHKGIQGTVLVGFIVEANGRITNVKVIDSVHPLLDAEAIRVTRLMPKWIPATKQGRAVRSSYYMPMRFALDGVQELENVFHKVEKPPEFKGGGKAISEFLKEFLRENENYYLRMAQIMEIQGTVLVSFVVEKDGRISNVKVIKSLHITLDEEAVRIVKSMPNWIPGTIGGEAVRAWYDMCVGFTFSKHGIYSYYISIKKRDT